MRALRLMKVDVRKLSLGHDAVLGQAVMQFRQFPVIGTLGMISRGPIWRGASDVNALADHLAGFRHPVLVNSEDVPAHDMGDAGFLSLMSETTISRLHLDGELRPRMHQKWRNRLRKAEQCGLQVIRREFPPDPGHWLLQAEMKQRQVRRYRGLPTAFAVAFTKANRGGALLFVARQRCEPVAGLLILRHGRMATYHIGHTFKAGRTLNAHTLLIARAAEYLASSGTEILDLGTVDTVNAPGLARFKLGTGAQAYQLGGTWLYSRRIAPVARALQVQVPSAAARISRIFAP